ncbi:MAG: polysaccharide deacetylase family protein [Firmicutes bacterium]|nr:polysaccharide deacetylase family protein [Bacillota bacterium]
MIVVLVRKQTRLKALATVLLLGFIAISWTTRYSLSTIISQVSGKLRPIYRVTAARNAVALTFDISWGEVSPTRVLDALRSKGVRSTFFLSGPWAAAHPDVVRRIASDGHEIASHGYHHDNYSQLSRERIAQDLRKTREILTNLAGREAKILRPPNGDFDDMSIMAAMEEGYLTIIWSLDSLDWKNPGVDYMIDRLLTRAQAGDIILCHASDSARETYLALPAVIDGIRQKGLEFVTVTELLGMAGEQYMIQPDRNLLR